LVGAKGKTAPSSDFLQLEGGMLTTDYKPAQAKGHRDTLTRGVIDAKKLSTRNRRDSRLIDNQYMDLYQKINGPQLSIWELADIQYFSHTLVDTYDFRDDECNSDSSENEFGLLHLKKRQYNRLYDYIDSIGKIKIFGDSDDDEEFQNDKPPQAINQLPSFEESSDTSKFSVSMQDNSNDESNKPANDEV